MIFDGILFDFIVSRSRDIRSVGTGAISSVSVICPRSSIISLTRLTFSEINVESSSISLSGVFIKYAQLFMMVNGPFRSCLTILVTWFLPSRSSLLRFRSRCSTCSTYLIFSSSEANCSASISTSFWSSSENACNCSLSMFITPTTSSNFIGTANSLLIEESVHF